MPRDKDAYGQLDATGKPCPEKIARALDPFTRDEDGNAQSIRARDMSPKFAAMLEFLIQVPLPQRAVNPAIESLCTTSDCWLIGNGDFLGSATELQANLERWMDACGVTKPAERQAFQAMVDANMGVPYGCYRVEVA
jgi:hypothetical protein